MGLAGILDAIAQLSLTIIETLGYTGVFLLMVAESMVLPVPSEAVLPPAGWLAWEGRMDFGLALLVATAGTIVGSLLSYGMGVWGLRPALERWGRYVLVTPRHLAVAHTFFERRGGATTIFVSRFVPVVRHLISIPAGSARMPLVPFVLATTAGGALWNFVLLYAGFKLGENWHAVTAVVDAVKWPLLAALVLVGGVFAALWWMRMRRRRAVTRLPGE